MSASRLPDDKGSRPNTLGLHRPELETLLNDLDKGAGQGAMPHRVFARWPFRSISVGVTVHHPGGTSVSMKLACRNLSRGGIGLLHSGYFHTGSRCTVVLPNLSGGQTSVAGIIGRCEHRRGVIHELGVRFNSVINIRDHVRADPFDHWFSLESVDPTELSGTLLHVESSSVDQKIVRHYLRDTRVRLRCAASAREALSIAREGCDLIMAEYHLPDSTGGELARALHADGIGTTMIISSADTSEQLRAEMRRIQADAFLAKPYTQDSLLRAIAEFLSFSDPGETTSTAIRGQAADELVAIFSLKVKEYADQLEQAMREDRAVDAYVICVQMKGTAPSLGFREIGELASALANRISAGSELQTMGRQISDLIDVCRETRRDAA